MGKKEIKISFGTFIAGIIAIILVVVIIIMGMYIANQNKKTGENPISMGNNGNVNNIQQEQTSQNNTETALNKNNSNSIQELDINSTLVQKLYGYINDEFRTNFDPNTYLSYYRSEKITNSTLEDDIKLLTVCRTLLDDKKYTITKNENLRTENAGKISEYKVIDLGESYFYDHDTKQYVKKENDSYRVIGDVYVFSIDSIQEKAKEIFNTTINIQKHSFPMLATGLFYDNNTYKYFESEGGGDYPYYDMTKLLKAEQKDDEVYLYDNYLRIAASYETSEAEYYYATSDKTIKLPSKEYIDSSNYSSNFTEGNTLPLYKHTFKKNNNGTYYWVSSELTNKNELTK